MTEESVAEVVALRLAERGLVLGTIECGIDGAAGHALFATEDGPAALGNSLSVATAEEAIDFLGLPWQQFKASGDFSAKAARAAARAGREFLEVDVCLAVWAMPLPAEAGAVQETVYLALNTGEDVLEETLRYDGPADGMWEWLVEQALDLVQQTL